ncbi:MAG: hypothetical protein K6F32_05565 [Bacilli bacterium]|nr:hypothetical protein [Bacilli bacterium]
MAITLFAYPFLLALLPLPLLVFALASFFERFGLALVCSSLLLGAGVILSDYLLGGTLAEILIIAMAYLAVGLIVEAIRMRRKPQ